MGADIIIVREYLESLRETEELDHIFSLLLISMDHQIVQSPRESRGQSQYGKDIVSIGIDEDGVKWRYYFELKGHADKDITDHVFSKPDGIRDSLMALKYADFDDNSIEGFNNLPVKYVLVHNGTLRANTRPTFKGFVRELFPDGNFERWDIYKLSDLFAKYLFGEFLLTNKDNLVLFKKTLVLVDSPDYDARDFLALIENLLGPPPAIESREFEKLFTTIHLVCYILKHYSDEAGNLAPAKKGIAYCVLKTWSWILKYGLDQRLSVLVEFRKLLLIHHSVLNEYFRRTAPIALEEDGLFSEAGRFFEYVGYPLRAFEYLGDLVYFFAQRQYFPRFDGTIPTIKKWRLEDRQKELLMRVLEQNDGCARPLLDNHYIPIALAVVFVMTCDGVTPDDSARMHNYIVAVFKNILLVKRMRNRLPEMYSRVEALVEYVATGEKPPDYEETSSILIPVLMELLAVLGLDGESYRNLRTGIHGVINLQLPIPPSAAEYPDREIDFFAGNIYDITAVESDIVWPETMEELHTKMANSSSELSLTPRTDAAGFPFLKILSSTYFKNDVFPENWRSPFRSVFTDFGSQ